MSTDYAVKFALPAFKRASLYLEVPLARNGTLYRGRGEARVSEGALGEQCPGCGGDLTDTWSLVADDGGQAPYLGSAIRAKCDCGFRTVGDVVAWDR